MEPFFSTLLPSDQTSALIQWLEHRTETRPTHVIQTLQQICDSTWPCSKDIHVSKTIISSLSISKHSVVTIVCVKDKLFVMKECLYEKEHDMPEHVMVEILMLAYLATHLHVGIAACMGVYIQSKTTCIYSEYIPLNHYTLFNNRVVYAPIHMSTIYKLTKILSILEEHGIAHRDVKIANLAYRASGDVVLLDFDSAACRLGGRTTERDICTITTRAPEIYDVTTDYCIFRAQVWSLGIIWCEMILLQNMFESSHTPKDFVEELIACQTPRMHLLQQRMTQSSRAILLEMLQLDPLHRICLQALVVRFESCL
jgi:hypothetical protein